MMTWAEAELLQERVEAISDADPTQSTRYVLRSTGVGPGFGVFDRAEHRFVPHGELLCMSVEELRDTKLPRLN